MEFKPSVYQEAIFSWVDANVLKAIHLVMEAVAGSGKTKTSVEIYKRLPPKVLQNSIFCAFNSHIAKELKNQLPFGANAKTYHAIGNYAIHKKYPDAILDENKIETILKSKLIGDNVKFIAYPVKRIVGLLKGSLAPVTYEQMNSFALDHDIDLYDDENDTIKSRIFELTAYAMEQSLNPNTIDFDDMPWLPLVDDAIVIPKYDLMVIDEVQDTNPAQLFLAINSITKNGTIIGAGDRRQSIYAFRGADEGAMGNLVKELGADTLPLSICYRCSKAVGQYVNQEFPEIKFEIPDWANEGKIETISENKVLELIKPDDMVLCRVNADLVPMAFSLIRNGVKATIRGRDIGKNLVALIRKQKADDVSSLFDKLYVWREKQAIKFVKANKPQKIMQIDDQIATIEALSEEANSVWDIIGKCEEMFSDDKKGITLSTIHKAKGLEAANTFILRPELMPHPAAKSDRDRRQEENIRYVAITRSQNNVSFVQP